MLTGSTVLVDSCAGSDHVGVRRDADGEVWLASWTDLEPERVAGALLVGLEPDRVFGSAWFGVGGLAPKGTRRAEFEAPDGAWHEAAVGDGAWAAIVPCPPWTDTSLTDVALADLPVRLLDDGGALVSRVTPRMLAASRRVGLVQRFEQRMFPRGLPLLCPVCRGGNWRVMAKELGRGERIFCGKCGHGHRGGLVA